VAVLGAECTGKSTLVEQMQAALHAQGVAATVVPEALRAFSARMGRTPMAHEQQVIADTQTASIAQAAAQYPVVIADTTALMTAVYSEQVFGDTSLYPQAERDQRACRLTLLAATDLPWQGDGYQRDGPAVQQAVDRLLRSALDRSGTPYAVITGTGPARLRAAMAALQRAMAAPPLDDAPRWRYRCRRCDPTDTGHLAPAGRPATDVVACPGVGRLLRSGPCAPDTHDAQ
jgi:nicotinamide riboside kinase